MKSVICVLVIFLLSGCSVFYYGHTKVEWESLSEEEREKTKKSYENMVREKNQMVHGDPREEATKEFVERALNNGSQGIWKPSH